MKNYSENKTVRTYPKYLKCLDSDRITPVNLRLNNRGRDIINRHNADNLHGLLTAYGLYYMKNTGLVQPIITKNKKSKPIYKITKYKEVEKKVADLVTDVIDFSIYPAFVSTMYSDALSGVTFRSLYTGQTYFENLNKYGANRDALPTPDYFPKITDILNQYMAPWLEHPEFEDSFETLLQSGKWLTHIKTGVNSGYDANDRQDKTMILKYVSATVSMFNKWKAGDKINWTKVPFEMGYRTERKGTIRIICQACSKEKIASSVLNTILDQYAKDLPFDLPRKFGDFKNVVAKIFENTAQDTNYVSKDFDKFDRNIPLCLYIALRNWFKQFGSNTVAQLIAFELDIIINSNIIVDYNKVFFLKALPSGVGTTQFIGSMIHWLLDLLCDIEYKFKVYQSDDNVGVTKMNAKEFQSAIKIMEAQFGIQISPVGEKTFFNERQVRFLQKIIDYNSKIYYNHEVRAFTNGIFRERCLNVEESFADLFGLNKESPEAMKAKNVLSFEGNLVSYGIDAPSLIPIFGLMFSTPTGPGVKSIPLFTKQDLIWGGNHLQDYMKWFYETEQHRVSDNEGWAKFVILEAAKNIGGDRKTMERVIENAIKDYKNANRPSIGV